MSAREVWLPVVGYEGVYEVSNMGVIRRDPKAPARSLGVPGKPLKPMPTTGGYHVVSLSLRGVVDNVRVSRVVLTAFCGPPPFDGAQAAHNDGDNSNNRLTNLRWATPIENQADIERHGNRCKGSAVHGAVLDEEQVRLIRERCHAGERNPAIATDFGVSISTIHLIRHNRTWRHVA